VELPQADAGGSGQTSAQMLQRLEKLAGTVGNQIVERLKTLVNNQDALVDEVTSLRFLKLFSAFERVFQTFEETRNNQFVSYIELLKKQSQSQSRYGNEPDDQSGLSEAIKWFSCQLRYVRDFSKKCVEKNEQIESASQAVVAQLEKSLGEMVSAWTTGVSKILGGVDFEDNMIVWELHKKTRVVILKFPADREQLLQQAAVLSSLDFRLTRDVDSEIRKLRAHQQ
jgi:hypothetical protein